MEEEKRIAVIDMDSVVYSIINPNKVLDEFGVPKRTEDNSKFLYTEKTENEVIESAKFIMNDIFVSSNCTHYIGFIKGRNTISYRKSINPEYKANRGTEPPKLWNFCKDYLIKEYNIVEANNLEVDDFVHMTKLALKDSFICCIDSDLLGTEGVHFSWRKKEWITTTKEQAEYKFWVDMICGTHNNTKGIPGKGIKFAEKCLEETDGLLMKSIVFENYLHFFGEYEGIQEFYKNYMSLKLLDSYEGFVIPEPIKVVIKIEENKVDNLL